MKASANLAPQPANPRDGMAHLREKCLRLLDEVPNDAAHCAGCKCRGWHRIPQVPGALQLLAHEQHVRLHRTESLADLHALKEAAVHLASEISVRSVGQEEVRYSLLGRQFLRSWRARITFNRRSCAFLQITHLHGVAPPAVIIHSMSAAKQRTIFMGNCASTSRQAASLPGCTA